MTTNLVDHKYANKTTSGILGMLMGNERPILLEEDRKIDDAINLLRRAQKTIETAERVISEQTRRIQSLEETNTTDELTGLLNYRGFEQAFIKERSRLRRNLGQTGMIILVEIENHDFVKTKHGRAAADACLKLIARILKDEIRDMDSVSRIEKDVFALLFAGTNTAATLDRSQKLAMKLNKLSLVKSAEEIRISASISLQDFNANTEFSSLFTGQEKEQKTA